MYRLIKKYLTMVVFVTATALNTKIREVENKIPGINQKYLNTSDYNKFTSAILDTK